METITTFHVEMLGVGYVLTQLGNVSKAKLYWQKTVICTKLILAYVHSSEKVSTLALVSQR